MPHCVRCHLHPNRIADRANCAPRVFLQRRKHCVRCRKILAELALTYESIQLFDRSNEVWRRLVSLGPSAGPLYELAAPFTGAAVEKAHAWAL